MTGSGRGLDQTWGSSGDDAKAWASAKEILKSLGRVTPAFSIAIRSLMVDAAQPNPGIRPGSHFLLLRLLKSPSMKAIIFYSALTFHTEKVASAVYLSSSDLIRLFGPQDMAAIVGLVYMYRRLRTAAKLDDQLEWPYFLSSLLPRVDLGYHLGAAIPQIGPGKALIAAGFPRVAQACFALKAPDALSAYRHSLESRGLLCDVSYERQHFGASVNDLCGNMLQLLGFGTKLAGGIKLALSEFPPSSEEIDRDGFDFFMAEKWSRALLQNGAEPAEKLPGKYYPLQKDSYKLMYEVNQLRENGSKHGWLNRNKSDISAQTTPQLYQEVLAEAQQPEQLKEFFKSNLPDEVLNSLSAEELSQLASNGSPDSGLE